jgi:hypothetical protein
MLGSVKQHRVRATRYCGNHVRRAYNRHPSGASHSEYNDLSAKAVHAVYLSSSRSTRMHTTLHRLTRAKFPPLKRRAVDTLQLNLGYRCKLTIL